MLCVQNQRHVHHFGVQRVRLFAFKQMQEVTANAVVIGVFVNANTVMAKAIPVGNHRWEGCQQTVSHVLLIGKRCFGLKVTQH